MKKVFLWFAAAAFMLAACSDDSSTQAKGVPDSGEDSPVAEVNKDSSATEPEGDFTVDVSGTDSTGKGFFKGSSCQADESQFENAVAGKALKKTTSEDKYGEGGLERSFYVEDAGNSDQVFVSGLVSGCQKTVTDIDVKVQGDTLYASVDFKDYPTYCICSWVDMSFTVEKGLLDDSVKTLVIGEEVFTLREEEPAVADSAVTEPVMPEE